ncbi:polysaccharide biosynthesis protein [Ramlibacter alkalitolerans]|uniref:Polysaccharide biosynthesis protein n=1 Tax=Ramlibacter alkalitolerans TaxID=2039631 RepID=A0ABS1JP70_9BURK|nr:nucleoside-diphosphate sugar epimerase/dehydratase [Ramlibacter alkalitolerans]MBL0426070.1 polysaccharide biosynthesis protein [Ramlibacter alkalitolerans]
MSLRRLPPFDLTHALQALVDVFLLLLAWALAFWLRFNLDVPQEYLDLAVISAPVCVLAHGLTLGAMRVHRQVWDFIGLPDLRQLTLGVLLGGLVTAMAVMMFRLPLFPRSVLLLHPVLALVLLGAVRAAWRTVVEHLGTGRADKQPLVVVGSLQDASGALRALKGAGAWEPVAILSPLRAEVGRALQSVRVLGTVSELRDVCEFVHAQTVLVASAPGSAERREALMLAADAGTRLLHMPRADEWLNPHPEAVRQVELEDLLGREPVALDVAGLAELFSGRTVLVTGAGGSIGSELCRQIARFGAARLVCVDVSEYSIYALEQELRQAHPRMEGVYYTANVRDFGRLRAIACEQQPTVVFHAAAYKHVPLMEEHNAIEALRTNVLGTVQAARAAAACGARRFVMISTDKAVNPTNVMGASKRLAELMVQAIAVQEPGTQFVSVRFGNVLGSSGSVVPLFTRQIARGGPVTVTHPEIVRYFMTIPEAAQLVLQAGLMGRSGQIFVLDMGEPVKIVELARMLIRLSGKSEQEVPITFTGLRPGEKLYEELLASDETSEPTPHPKLRIAKTAGPLPEVAEVLRWMEEAGPQPQVAEVRAWLGRRVPEYAPADSGRDAGAREDVADQLEPHERVVQLHQPLFQRHR